MTTVARSTPALHRDDEPTQVLRWRLEQLRQAGYPDDDAIALAVHGDVDLHLAARLLREHCPPETALRILL